MIVLIEKPDLDDSSIENIKILENYNNYNDIALFWKEKESNLYFSLLDGNMTVSGKPSNEDETKAFLNLISPKSIFADFDFFKMTGLTQNTDRVNVLYKQAINYQENKSDIFNSKQVYDIIKTAGLDVPQYEYFATDYCKRLNSGNLKYYGIRDKAVAVTIGRNNVILNGIASCKKGFGSIVLKGIETLNAGKNIFLSAKDDVLPFYLKNGYKVIGFAGYRRKI